AIQKANILGNAQVEKIEKELLGLGNLEQHFSNFNDNDNPIVAILDKYTRGIYFGLHNDANDPFIMLASLDGEVVIAIDTSGNCATVNENGKVELTRTLEEEMKQQANPSLAFIQLTRIANHDKWSIERPFYFQFTGKDRVLPLEDKDYNLESIEKLFMNSKGDHSYIFRDLEFLVPTYLYDDRDILGVRQVDSRGVFNNDTKIIIYVIAFNFLDYISTQPRIQRELIKLDASKKTIKDSTELKVQKLGSEITATMETIRVFNLARVFLNCLVIVACLGIFSVLRRD
nr:hypothetical protein [Candidatus Woesearchaeota archaeon]